MFTAALFVIARTWKQPKCPSTDEWIKMWYTHTHTHTHTHTQMEYYSAIKKNEIMSFSATWMVDWEFGVSRCQLLYREWLNNKVLLYSTGNYIRYPMINHNGKEYEKGCMYM